MNIEVLKHVKHTHTASEIGGQSPQESTYNKSCKAPLVSSHLILKQSIGTAWDTIDCIIAAHDAGPLSHTGTGFKCWEVGLERERGGGREIGGRKDGIERKKWLFAS